MFQCKLKNITLLGFNKTDTHALKRQAALQNKTKNTHQQQTTNKQTKQR